MLHSNHFALAALVGLAAISAFSCSKDLETPEIQTASRVKLKVQAFDIDQSGFSSGRTKADSKDPFKRLAFKVFNEDGVAVFDTTQCYTQTGFGSVDFLLPEGTYTFVAVGHNVSTDKASDSTVVASISSVDAVTLPEQNIVDLFSATKEVTILPAKDSSISMSLPRVNTKFKLVMTDAIPANAATMEFVLNANGTESTADHTIDPSTGFASSDRQYVRTFDVSSAAGKTGQSISINLLLTAVTKDIDVMITAYDANEDVIISRLLEDVPMKQNRITTATGVFFNSEASATFSVGTTWDTEHAITY